MTQRFTPDFIKQKLLTDNYWLFRAVIAVHACQTFDEKMAAETVHKNKRGFNKPDAAVLSPYAEELLSGGRLDDKAVSVCRRRMPKYAKQLARIANKKG